jgi:hypothetical protein
MRFLATRRICSSIALFQRQAPEHTLPLPSVKFRVCQLQRQAQSTHTCAECDVRRKMPMSRSRHLLLNPAACWNASELRLGGAFLRHAFNLRASLAFRWFTRSRWTASGCARLRCGCGCQYDEEQSAPAAETSAGHFGSDNGYQLT